MTNDASLTMRICYRRADQASEIVPPFRAAS